VSRAANLSAAGLLQPVIAIDTVQASTEASVGANFAFFISFSSPGGSRAGWQPIPHT
jgi:hypothetical protein